MRANWKDLIKLSVQEEPSLMLFEKVLKKIESKPRSVDRLRGVILALSGMLLIAMSVLMVFVWQKLSWDFSNSGLSQIFSLLFSDFNVVAVYWQDFVWSVLENLPVVAIIDFLIVLMIMVGTTGLISAEMRGGVHSKWYLFSIN